MRKIIFSRHAKRRIKLYGINKEDIINVIKNAPNKSNGQYEIIDSRVKSKYRLPLIEGSLYNRKKCYDYSYFLSVKKRHKR